MNPTQSARHPTDFNECGEQINNVWEREDGKTPTKYDWKVILRHVLLNDKNRASDGVVSPLSLTSGCRKQYKY